MDRQKFQKAFEEIQGADKLGKLSWPIQYEETLAHLPYICACIREGLRLNPPASNLFARVVGKEGKVIEGNVLPAGTEITAYSYGKSVFCPRHCQVPNNQAERAVVVQRDKDLYAPDPDAFRPERWLESVEHANEMEAGNYGFGMGPRVRHPTITPPALHHSSLMYHASRSVLARTLPSWSSISSFLR